jgi:hypothetical protein
MENNRQDIMSENGINLSGDSTDDSNFNTSELSDSGTTSFKLKTETSTPQQKVFGSSYTPSISDAYQDAMRSQIASSNKHYKKMNIIRYIKMTVFFFILAGVAGLVIYYLMTHLPSTDSDKNKTTDQRLVESDWTVEDNVTYDFSDDSKVIRNDGAKKEAGTYELTDDNVLIMDFNGETLSYLVEYDSDGNMTWTHSYNGFEDVIYPEAVGE